MFLQYSIPGFPKEIYRIITIRSKKYKKTLEININLRSCLEFILKDIQRIFPGGVFFKEHSEFCNEKDGTKGENRPEIEIEKLRPNSSLK